MKNKEVEKLLACSNCELKECITCDITYTDRKKIREYIEKLEQLVDLMADKLVEAHEWFYSEFDNFTKEDFIKYFENKVNSSEQN